MNASLSLKHSLFLASMAFLAGTTAPKAAPVIRSVSGVNPAAIQASVDQFRTDLGGSNNGVGGTFLTGRREINWDGVPDSFSEPNNLPVNFFNVNSPRGIIFHTIAEEGSGGASNVLAVSADSNNPTATTVQFGNILGSYATEFQTFSAERLFVARNSSNLGVSFFVPGTTLPATVSGFGAVFTDVDSASGKGRTIIRYYGVDGAQLTSAVVPALDKGLSFVGVSFNAGERVARVVIELGTEALLGAAESASVDVVAMDDFIYGEPQPLDFTDNGVRVSLAVPLRVKSVVIDGSTPAGFVSLLLQCSPSHTYRLFRSPDLINWQPALVFGAAVGTNQNLFTPRQSGNHNGTTKTERLHVSKEGQPKMFYRILDETTGDLTCFETP